MESLDPIPSPPGHLFREFCHRALPVLAFAGAIASTALVWNHRFTGTLVYGEVEAVQSHIITIEGGTLVQFDLDRFQSVTNGQILGTVETLDPDAVRSELNVLRTELGVLRSRMALDQTRNDQNVADLRIRWFEARVDLATARVQVENARRELERTAALHRDQILPAAELDVAQSIHDALVAEIEERSATVDALAEAVARFEDVQPRERADSLQMFDDSLSAQETLLTKQGRHRLRATLDGLVQQVFHRPGERLPPGAVVATITSPDPRRIVGYFRPPLILDPQAGMPVEIRTRSLPRQTALSHIASVGVAFEPVSPTLSNSFFGGVDLGLPFFVNLPPDLKVLPGERVDIVVRPSPSSATP